MKPLFPFHTNTEVAEALRNGLPLVALESTIISHGMPYPENLETAKTLENIVREEGAVPATIALIKGKLTVGLSEENLHFLATEKNIHKASRRDMAWILSQGLSAATTVSATMIGAHLAGIQVFATGGVGGVHRGAQQTFDISADLQELAKTPVAVVSAGVKSILDIPLTLEYLETMGVPVVGVGTDEFPAFYTRESGSKVPIRLNSPEDIAKLIRTHREMGLTGGFLVANPIPEEYSMDKAMIDKVIEQAISDSEEDGISGKELTPYLLGRIKDLTEGESLFSNIQLVCNNARVGSRIAIELQKIK